MWIDYFIYLSQLSPEERTNQICMLIVFFTIMFLIGIIDEFIRRKIL